MYIQCTYNIYHPYTIHRILIFPFQDNLEGEGALTRDNGAHGSTSGEAGGTNKNAYNAYTALQKAQEEIKQLRSENVFFDSPSRYK